MCCHSQLTMMKKKEQMLQEFDEGPLDFQPTYKFDLNSDTYDSRYLPSWIIIIRPTRIKSFPFLIPALALKRFGSICILSPPLFNVAGSTGHGLVLSKSSEHLLVLLHVFLNISSHLVCNMLCCTSACVFLTPFNKMLKVATSVLCSRVTFGLSQAHHHLHHNAS